MKYFLFTIQLIDYSQRAHEVRIRAEAKVPRKQRRLVEHVTGRATRGSYCQADATLSGYARSTCRRPTAAGWIRGVVMPECPN